jgi:uncharacterized OsmC-like protein
MSEQTAKKEDAWLNGVNVTQLGDTINLVKSNSEIAKFRFRTSNKWMTGGHNRSTIKDFYGACQEDTSRKEAFIVDNDEPVVLVGEDKAANPVEYVLHALAGCMTTTMVYKAALHGIKIYEVESELEGDIDLRGMLELADDVRNGFQNIRVNFKVKAEGGEKKRKLLEALAKGSPVFDIITNPVPVTLSVETK